MSVHALAPLQLGVPGATELVVILLIFVLLFGLPLVVLGLIVVYVRRENRKIDELEERLEEMERREEAAGAGGAADRDETEG